MNHDEALDAMTFAELYRRAREAGIEKHHFFDLQRGLNELQAWIDREVDMVAETETNLGSAKSARSGRRMELDIPALPTTQQHVALRGRRKLLDELLGLMRRPADGPAVLAGVGGAGKTTVAAEVAKLVSSWDRLVWWVSAVDPASLSAGLVSVARQLDGSSVDIETIARGRADAPDRLWRLLEHAPREWLLIIDNADDPWVLAAGDSPPGVQDDTGWIRSSRRGLVLVTSRDADPRMWGAARLYRIGPLDEANAAQVLRDLAPAAGDDNQARVLARHLDGLPLALHLAGTYLRSDVAQWSTFAAYGRALREGREPSLLDSSEAQASHRLARAAVTRPAEISLDGLAQHGIPQARVLLRLTSCYAPTLIPTNIFEARSTSDLFGAERGSRNPRHLLEEALQGLRDVGLIQWLADSTAAEIAISVHSDVINSNRTYLDKPEPDSDLIRHTAVDYLVTAIQKLRFDLPADWPQYRMLGHHLLAILDTTAEHLDREHLVELMAAAASTARAFNRSGASKATRALCYVALERCSALGNAEPMSLRVRHQLAWAIADKGNLAEAETMYQEILDTRLGVLGNRDPDILESRHELAWITACQDRWSQAESRYRQTLDDSLRILGSDEPRTLTTRHELAWAIANQGRLDEAHSACREVLRDRQRVLGADHPQTLATRHELAWITAKQGRWAKAEAIYREVLDLRQRKLEEDHRETLLTAHELAWTIARQGWRAKAESLYEDVLTRRRRTLGDDHPDTQMTQRALGELRHGRIVDAHHFV